MMGSRARSVWGEWGRVGWEGLGKDKDEILGNGIGW